jgi:hypothetical protein
MACCSDLHFPHEPRETWQWEPKSIEIRAELDPNDTAGVLHTVAKPVALPRGGLLVQTSIGNIQFGVPPETIKDILLAVPPLTPPIAYIVPDPLFCAIRHVNMVCPLPVLSSSGDRFFRVSLCLSLSLFVSLCLFGR